MNNITPGKFYKTRNGLRVRIYATDAGGERPIHGAYLEEPRRWKPDSWRKNGEWCFEGSTDLDPDIIGEWTTELQLNWADIPPWLNYVAMDADKMVYGYDRKPAVKGEVWYYPDCVHMALIPPPYCGPLDGIDWRDSLTVRPGFSEPKKCASKKESKAFASGESLNH
jgi:hypothetical protein